MNASTDLRPLKKYLQVGEITELAGEIGITARQASNIINGRCRNFQFVEKFLQRVETNKALFDKANSI